MELHDLSGEGICYLVQDKWVMKQNEVSMLSQMVEIWACSQGEVMSHHLHYPV